MIKDDVALCLKTVPRGITEHEREEMGILEIGNWTPSGSQAGQVIGRGGVAPTVTENHGCVFAVMDYRYDEGFRIRDELISPTICAQQGRLDERSLGGGVMLVEK